MMDEDMCENCSQYGEEFCNNCIFNEKIIPSSFHNFINIGNNFFNVGYVNLYFFIFIWLLIILFFSFLFFPYKIYDIVTTKIAAIIEFNNKLSILSKTPPCPGKRFE